MAYSLWIALNIDGLQQYSGGILTLDANSPALAVDYGADVAGFLFIHTSSISGSTQIELKCFEPFNGLSMLLRDGPF